MDTLSKNNAVANLLKRALERPCHIEDRSPDKPRIAIVNSFMEYSPGDAHLLRLAQKVKEGISSEGGTSVEIFIPGFCGELKKNASVRKYYFAYRDFATAMVEFLVGFHDFDGAMFLCTCDNQVPAFVLGALRVDLPCVFVTGGYMSPGKYNGQDITAFSVAKQYGRFQSGECTRAELDEMVQSACPTCGACPELGTANTMCILTEALGLSMTGCSTLPAESERLDDLAYLSGKQIIECVHADRRPRSIVTKSSLLNAIRVCLAMGGSTNAVIHLIAYAREIGVDIGLDDWDALSETTPLVCAISPNQKGFYMNRLDEIGGLTPVLKVLEPLLDLTCGDVAGRTLGERLANVQPVYDQILRPLDAPFSEQGGLIILKGNLAPDGGILKVSSIHQDLRRFTGKAIVFDCEEAGMDFVISRKAKKGDVLIVRYEGPCAGPGSRECVSILHALVGQGLQNDVAVVTDGRLSGTNLGLAVCNISPEAIKGTAMALVENGDTVEIDIENKRINVLLSEAELQERKRKWCPPEPKVKTGILALYGRSVSQLSEGARII